MVKCGRCHHELGDHYAMGVSTTYKCAKCGCLIPESETAWGNAEIAGRY